MERLRINFYWPNMTVDVKDYIRSCETCQQTKPSNITRRSPMSAPYTVQRPFQKLYVDLLGPYPRSKQGNICIFIVLDHYTKFPLLKAVKNFNAIGICDFLKENVFSIFGTPELILSDNGKQFKSSQFNNLLAERGIRHVYTALYSPQANASERVNRSIIAGIRAYLKDDQALWDKHLASIAEALRSSLHQSIGCTAYYALFGQQMPSHGDEYTILRKLGTLDDNILDRNDKLALIRDSVAENIRKAFECSARRYNLRSSTTNFKIGDTVYRRNFVLSDATKKFCAKFAPKFVKAKVIAKKGNCLYELEDVLSRKRAIYNQKDRGNLPTAPTL